MVENKQVMAKNILHYMNVKNVTATDVCKACGFKQNTFSDWVNAKTYPRIDKIEAMAQFFGINKSCLVEDTDEAKKIREDYVNDTLSSDDRELLDLYHIASPEVKAMVDFALKGIKHNS